MNNLKIMDYQNNICEIPVDLDSLSNVEWIDITVTTGDEIAKVKYKNGVIKRYDSAELMRNLRIKDFYDYSYFLYDSRIRSKINHIARFNKRKDSYDMADYLYEYEERRRKRNNRINRTKEVKR